MPLNNGASPVHRVAARWAATHLRRLARLVPLLHEVLLSGYCALAYMWYLSNLESGVWPWVLTWVTSPIRWIRPFLARVNPEQRLMPNLAIEGYAFLIELTALGLLCLFLVGRIRGMRAFVLGAAGVFTTAGFGFTSLVCWGSHFVHSPPWPSVAARILWIELAVAVLFVLMYLWRRWLRDWWSSTLFLTLHFGLWFWVMDVNCKDGHCLEYTVSVCATLLWWLRMRLQPGQVPTHGDSASL